MYVQRPLVDNVPFGQLWIVCQFSQSTNFLVSRGLLDADCLAAVDDQAVTKVSVAVDFGFPIKKAARLDGLKVIGPIRASYGPGLLAWGFL